MYEAQGRRITPPKAAVRWSVSMLVPGRDLMGSPFQHRLPGAGAPRPAAWPTLPVGRCAERGKACKRRAGWPGRCHHRLRAGRCDRPEKPCRCRCRGSAADIGGRLERAPAAHARTSRSRRRSCWPVAGAWPTRTGGASGSQPARRGKLGSSEELVADHRVREEPDSDLSDPNGPFDFLEASLDRIDPVAQAR
jgi:hypothetical protein